MYTITQAELLSILTPIASYLMPCLNSLQRTILIGALVYIVLQFCITKADARHMIQDLTCFSKKDYL